MVYKEGMDQWHLAVTSDPAAKGSAKDLEVASAGPVHCHFSLPPSFLTMCSSERCLSLVKLIKLVWLISGKGSETWRMGSFSVSHRNAKE